MIEDFYDEGIFDFYLMIIEWVVWVIGNNIFYNVYFYFCDNLKI